MKLILDINNPDRRYDFNAYTAFEFDDGSCSPDNRKIFTDNVDEFIAQLKQLIRDNAHE